MDASLQILIWMLERYVLWAIDRLSAEDESKREAVGPKLQALFRVFEVKDEHRSWSGFAGCAGRVPAGVVCCLRRLKRGLELVLAMPGLWRTNTSSVLSAWKEG
ncbi:hypothetical protein [Corallococcus interemptor]|uniref:hypothetical protein n=1 Tax=Corallococcus interemptor TaxID=2316720 RepID=UPI0011C38B24|nr:hypothetical protein [Corallococcus interemptor]